MGATRHDLKFYIECPHLLLDIKKSQTPVNNQPNTNPHYHVGICLVIWNYLVSPKCTCRSSVTKIQMNKKTPKHKKLP